MKILLLGEYSNVHHTLRDALRRLGHEVMLISDGDGWKNYPRDFDLSRKHEGWWGSVCYLTRLIRLLPRMCGYDVVQLINPDLLYLKPAWNRWLFRFLKWQNKIISVGCFGDDYYVIKRSQKEYVEQRMQSADDSEAFPYLEYTDFYAKGRVIDHALNQKRILGWVESGKAALTQYVMERADCLVACLYEYYKVYDTDEFRSKLHYIPLPIELPAEEVSIGASIYPLHILLAVQKKRSAMKGTDQMVPVFVRLADEHPDQVLLQRIESVPFAQYCRLLDEADVVVDQLYSYSPAMNALEAMGRGKVVVSGGEPDYYRFQESFSSEVTPLRPIINLRPFEPEQNYQTLCECLLDPELLLRLRHESRQFVLNYHQADHIAAQYLDLWQKILK